MKLLNTLLRHALASGVMALVAAVVWTATYLVLLLWALLTDSGLGGPLAYPIGLLSIVLMALTVSLAIFFPSTVLAEVICRRKTLPIVRAGIPITCGFVAAFIFLSVCITAAVSPPSEAFSPLIASALLFLALLLPLGCYWWASQFPSLLRKGFLRIKEAIEARSQGDGREVR